MQWQQPAGPLIATIRGAIGHITIEVDGTETAITLDWIPAPAAANSRYSNVHAAARGDGTSILVDQVGVPRLPGPRLSIAGIVQWKGRAALVRAARLRARLAERPVRSGRRRRMLELWRSPRPKLGSRWPHAGGCRAPHRSAPEAVKDHLKRLYGRP